jgi:hypothetical protein
MSGEKKMPLSYVEQEPEEMFMEPDDSQLDFIREVEIDIIAELDRLESEEQFIDDLFKRFADAA